MNSLEKLPYVVTDPKTDRGMPKAGDAVIVCRPDGSASFFLLDVNHKALLAKLKQDVDMTADEMGQLLAAQKAVTLFLVSQNEGVMQALAETVHAPDFFGGSELAALN